MTAENRFEAGLLCLTIFVRGSSFRTTNRGAWVLHPSSDGCSLSSWAFGWFFMQFVQSQSAGAADYSPQGEKRSPLRCPSLSGQDDKPQRDDLLIRLSLLTVPIAFLP